jgi:hypothetical protein
MATGGSQTAKVQVEVEARTDAAVANFEKLQSSTKKSREEVEKIEKATTRATSALRPLTAATEKHTAAQSKASGTALALGKAVDTAKGGTADMVRATLAATGALGPLGIAAGVAGTAVFNLGEEMPASFGRHWRLSSACSTTSAHSIWKRRRRPSRPPVFDASASSPNTRRTPPTS